MKYKNWLLALVLLGAIWLVADRTLELPAEAPGAAQPARDPGLRITEICAKNESVLPDNQGKYRDYIELFADGRDISLRGCTLSSDDGQQIPLGDITVAAGQYRVILLGEPAGFFLRGSQAQTITLRAADGTVLSQVQTMPMEADQVMALGDGVYTVTDEASPGFANTPQGLAAFREGFWDEKPPVVISELLTRNVSSLPDERGRYRDVAELRNVTDKPLNLGDYYLSDRLDMRFCYRLPEQTLDPGECLVVFCDGENYIAESGQIHTNFGLSRGESLILTGPDGGYRTVSADEGGEDVSIQLDEAGAYVSGTPSLGFANTQDGVAQALEARTNFESPLVISEVLLTSGGIPYAGRISDVVEIRNVSAQPVSTAGWYLSDGGDPYRCALPETLLQPGECLVLRCDREETGFGLSQGEVLRLTGPDHRHAPLLTCAEAPLGQSICLTTGGRETTYAMMPPSLGYANTQAGQESFRAEGQPQGLRISEVMTSNRAYLRGPYGAYCDLVELYNGSSEPISLKEYTLSDNAGVPDKCSLPDLVLEPGSYQVILLDTGDNMLAQGYPRLPLALSAKGDSLYLSRNGYIEDHVLIPELPQSTTYGRPNGSMDFAMLDTVTLSAANGKAVEISAAPVSVTRPGSYNGVEYLDIQLEADGEIYYTTNCQQPGRGTKRYTGPIRITETTVLRMVCYEPGKERSEVVSFTYLLNENDTLPVVSLVTDPANLWDYETGIYADGPNITTEIPYFGANYWQRWERAASVALYETDGTGFQENCAIRIFGGWTRRYSKKALACFFRGAYGSSKLEYPLFGEDSLPYYESFVLRAGGQDTYQARMRDEVITSLASEYLGLPVQDFRPVALYLNGEYWGVYQIREKLGESYVAGHFNVDADTVQIREDPQQGFKEYNEIVDFVMTHDMTKEENYAYLATKIDLQNYTDYMAAQLWIANNDMINVKYFIAEGYPITWILFDTDVAFWSYQDDTFTRMINPYGIGEFDRFGITFFVKLIKNPQYKDFFLKRLSWQMDNVWTQENIISRVDEIQNMMAGDMAKDSARWGHTYEGWLENVELLRTFARERNKYFPGFVQSYFDLTDQQMVDYGFLPRK